jgi:TRAP-type C4-dicarboxylate transport system permease small subunit
MPREPSLEGRNAMKFLEALTNMLNKVLMIAGGVSVLALMVLATGNVALRVFHVPFRGAYEIVSFLGAIVIAFALGYTQRRKDHIVVEILTERFPKKLQRSIDTFAYLVITIFFAVVSWQIFVWGMKIYVSHEVSETLKVIYHPFVFAVALAFAVVSFTALVDFLKNIVTAGDE